MGIIARAVIVTFLLFDFSLVWPEEDKIRLTTDDPLINQVVEKAPYFKYKADLYLLRLSADDYPAPLIGEFTTQLRHFCPNAYSPLSPQMPSEKLPLNSQTISQGESTPFKVNNTDSTCWNASAAFSKISNLFLIVWQDERNGVNNPDIYGQYFNQSLQPIGSNFRIHDENAGIPQSTPVVAPTSDGGFAAAWEDYREGKPAIFYRSFNASRVAKGLEVKVDPMQNKNQYFPAIAADSLGFFTIAWLQDDDGDFNIYCRKFDNSGQAERPGFKVNTDYQNLQWAPALASSMTGETLIAWEDKRNGNSDIFSQRIRADGTKQAGNFRINAADGGSTQWRPFVASQSGPFVVCWEDYQQHPNAVFAQWFDSTMLIVGSNVQIDDANDAGFKEYPVVAINKNKQSLFAWQDGRNGNWDIYVARCNADRVPQSAFSLNAEPLNGDQTRPKVIMGDNLTTFVWLGEFGTEEKQHVFTAQYNWTAVPVELAFFKTSVKAGDAYLEWVTLSESNNLGFEIQRKTQDEDFEKIGFIEGKGTTVGENSYSYIDKDLFPGTYTYRLKQMDYDGEYSYSNSTEIVVHGPSQFYLSQNYPNPFNGTTTIRYSLPQPATVSVEIFDILGERLAMLTEGFLPAGEKSINWDGKDHNGSPVSSGVYVYRIQVEERGKFHSVSRKMVYAR